MDKPIPEAVRKQFETWAKSRLYSTLRVSEDSDQYLVDHVTMMWRAWRAALTAAQQQDHEREYLRRVALDYAREIEEEDARAAQPMQQGGGEVIQRHVVTKCRDGSVHVADVATPPSAPVGDNGYESFARSLVAKYGFCNWQCEETWAAAQAALAQQPAACPKCGGTGEADSGGIMPWGAPAMIPCDCQQPAAVDGARVVETIRKALHHSYGAGHTDYVNFTEALDFLAAQHQGPTT